MNSVERIRKRIEEKSRKERRKKAETFKFKPDNLVHMPCRVRPDQKDFLEILGERGFNRAVLIRRALDREFRKKEYREYLNKFKQGE